MRRFSDGFVRTTGIGPNWTLGYHDPTKAGAFNPTISMNTTGNLIFQNATGGGSYAHVPLVPNVVGALNGKTQFAELKWTAGAVNAADLGPAVAFENNDLIVGGAMNGYFAAIKPNVNRIDVEYCDTALTVIQANVSALAIGDTLKISVTFGAASNLIQVFRNGAVVFTKTDTVGSPAGLPSSGLPAIYFGAGVAGASISVTNFRCGPGTN